MSAQRATIQRHEDRSTTRDTRPPSQVTASRRPSSAVAEHGTARSADAPSAGTSSDVGPPRSSDSTRHSSNALMSAVARSAGDGRQIASQGLVADIGTRPDHPAAWQDQAAGGRTDHADCAPLKIRLDQRRRRLTGGGTRHAPTTTADATVRTITIERDDQNHRVERGPDRFGRTLKRTEPADQHQQSKSQTVVHAKGDLRETISRAPPARQTATTTTIARSSEARRATPQAFHGRLIGLTSPSRRRT